MTARPPPLLCLSQIAATPCGGRFCFAENPELAWSENRSEAGKPGPAWSENRSRTKTLLCGPQSIFTAPSPWWQYTFAHQSPSSHTQNKHQPRHRFWRERKRLRGQPHRQFGEILRDRSLTFSTHKVGQAAFCCLFIKAWKVAASKFHCLNNPVK